MTYKKDMLDEQIECAIREKGVKARYREMESQMKFTEAAVAADIAAQPKKSGAHPGRVRWFYSLAAAACLLVACVGVNIKESADARSAYQAYVQKPSELYRGVDTPLDIKDIRSALERLENERPMGMTEQMEREYDEQIAFEKQSLHFNEALYHLSKGHFIRARRILKGIVSSEGAFADDARSILGNM